MPQGIVSACLNSCYRVSTDLGFTRLPPHVRDLVKKGRGDPPPQSDRPGVAGHSVHADGTDLDENSLVKKTNLYISECYNRYSNRISTATTATVWVKDHRPGPTGKESMFTGLYELEAAMATIVKSPLHRRRRLGTIEMPELEEVADKYVAALKDVVTAIQRQFIDYYEQEDYKDDNLRRRKCLTPALMASFANSKT